MNTTPPTDAFPPLRQPLFLVTLGNPGYHVLYAAYDFSGMATLANLGGVEDSHAVAIMQANPGMRGIFIEEPPTAETARKRLLAGGMLNLCDITAAGRPEALLAEADACLLSAFQRLSDADAVALMRRCRASMPAHGRLLIIETFVMDRMPRAALEPDPTLLAGTAADRLRTPDDAQALLREGGFRAIRFVPLDATVGLLEARPEDA